MLSWDGIPAQLKIREDEGGRPLSVPLSERWGQEIDRVAMAEGVVGTDEYLARWQWGPEQERQGSAEQVAAAVVAELEAQWETLRRR
ncbi:MAG TPA: virulence factor [Gaiella sp.]